MLVGIDLGSTNSALARVHPRTGEAEIIPAFEGLGALFSSSVEGFAFRKYQIAESPEIATALLRFLRAEAELSLEAGVDGARLAIPDNFEAIQRQALESAARQAGFTQVELIENSRCIVEAYGLGQGTRTLLLVHLGSSSLEVSLSRVAEGRIERLDYGYEGRGGRDWDFLLSQDLLQQNLQVEATAVERAKIDLSTRLQTRVGLLPVTRVQLEELAAPLLQRCRQCLEKVLQARPVEAVLLAGGAARMPMFGDLLHQLTGKIPLAGPNPEEVLALGAVRAPAAPALPVAPPRRAEGSTVMMRPEELAQLLEQVKREEQPEPAPPVVLAPPNPPPVVTQAPLPALDWNQLGGVLQGIQKSCWTPESPDGQRRIWCLTQDFVEHYFPGQGCLRVCQDGEPGSGRWGSVVFHRADGACDIVLRSGQEREHYYEFTWRTGQVPPQAPRRRHGQLVGQAQLQAAPGAPFLILECPEIQERIQFDPISLLRMDAESQKDRILKMLPWLRMLLWFGRLQEIDPPTFRNLPGPIRGFLSRPDFEPALTSIPPRALEGWIQQGLLPPELDPVSEAHAPALLQALTTQQNLGRQQPPSGGFLASLGLAPAGPKIPRLLLSLNPATLDLLDLQVFVTIGALPSQETTFDRELRKLLARRTDLQARLRSPEGQSSVLSDPEVMELKNRPDIVRENADRAWKATGQAGPNPLEQGEAMQRMFSMQMLTGYAFDPGAAAEKRPPWKVYKPYAS